MAEYAKPLPVLTDENRPFWEACRAGELRMQKCLECGHVRYPIQIICPRCLSERCEWARLSGKGTVFARLVFHRAYNKAFAADLPYNVVLVQLDEGPRMFSNVIGTPNEKIVVGARVEAVFEPVTPEITLPRFRPAGA